MDIDLFDECLHGHAIDRLGNSIIIIENPEMKAPADFPIRSDTSISVIIMSGSMECVVDMAVHRISEPGMLVILPSQIIERIFFSGDFKGYCLIMSSSFLADFPVGNKVPMIVSVMKQGFYPMGKRHMEAVENYMKMVQGALRAPGNNYRYEIVMHLTIAYYYGLGTYLHKTESDSGTASRYEQISDKFIRLVRENCHVHRDMEFYAGALCLSAKHINFAVKKITGDNAMKWIERYTVLRAKSLLKTTGLSINEISDSLNFPVPSDFGKYFKKFTGCSPSAFRKKAR